jgi:hypothetical protein
MPACRSHGSTVWNSTKLREGTKSTMEIHIQERNRTMCSGNIWFFWFFTFFNEKNACRSHGSCVRHSIKLREGTKWSTGSPLKQKEFSPGTGNIWNSFYWAVIRNPDKPLVGLGDSDHFLSNEPCLEAVAALWAEICVFPCLFKRFWDYQYKLL